MKPFTGEAKLSFYFKQKRLIHKRVKPAYLFFVPVVASSFYGLVTPKATQEYPADGV